MTIAWLSVHAAGCTDEAVNDDTQAATRAALLTYASIVRANYDDSLTATQTLNLAIEQLVDQPSETQLAIARQAWLDAREPYLQSEVYRFYDGPIDNPDDGPEGAMNAWPLDENYIDYTEGAPMAGIINDPRIVIDADTLLSLNEQGGEANVATGYHAIEFLLWGQDLSETGPGARPAADYFTDAGATAPNGDRRGAYLVTASQILVSQHDGLVVAWDESLPNSYGAAFSVADPQQTLARVMTGVYLLVGFETGGERIQAALDSGSQEDEHSCFSDNTHRDMVQDIRGIQNVLLGRYVRLDGSSVEGTGLLDVLRTVDSELADEYEAKVAECLMLAEALQPPFDREISFDNPAGRGRVLALVEALRDAAYLTEQAFIALKLTIPATESW